MDLELMKNEWSTLNAQLEKNNQINARIVHELIRSRTRTCYEQIARERRFGLSAIVLIATIMLPLQARAEVIRMESFLLIEAAVVVGLALLGYSSTILARLKPTDRPIGDVQRDMLRYKQLYRISQLFGAPIALVTIGVVYTIEQAFTANALAPLALFLMMAIVIGIVQTRRHNRLLQEIEQGLTELHEFDCE